MAAPCYNNAKNLKRFWGIPDLSASNCTIKPVVDENKCFEA
jgi:hypothetical protein